MKEVYQFEYIKKIISQNDMKIIKLNYLLFSPWIILVKKMKLNIDNKRVILIDLFCLDDL